MRTSRLGFARPVVRTTHSVILFWVGQFRLGIDASALKEIRNDQGLTAQVLGCEAILSAHALFGVAKVQGTRLLVLRPGRVAIRVDRVDRMIETAAVRSLPRAFQGAEREWYRGYIYDGDFVFPVLNPEALEREALLRSTDPVAAGSLPQNLNQGAASL